MVLYFVISEYSKDRFSLKHHFHYPKFLFQGDYIWIEPVTRREFDVAIGARVISADGRKIQVWITVTYYFS